MSIKLQMRGLLFLVVAQCAMPAVLQAAAHTFDGTADIPMLDGDTMTLASGTLTVDGDRVISLAGPEATQAATIKIGANSTSGSVTIKPVDETDAQLLFDVEKPGSVLTVEVLNDLLFEGNDTGNKPMHLSFRGHGTVRFRMPSGRTISFAPETPGTSTVGTKVRILMEQKRSEAADAPMVSFEKWSYAAADSNTDLALHSFVKVGQHSTFEFVSQHKNGLPDSTGSVDYGYSAVEFDPSNQGTGRLIIDIAKGVTDGDFADGSFNIYGSYIEGGGAGVTDVVTADFRTGITHKYRAGLEATVRIADGVLRTHFDGDAAGLATHLADTDNRRGLVILNHNHSFPRLANNYDQATAQGTEEEYTADGFFGLVDTQWFVANTTQTGFVLGNNGTLEVQHNTFLDYIAGAANAPLTEFPVAGTHVKAGATTASTDSHYQTKVKKHNPAALIIDGYAYRKTGTTAAEDLAFVYDSTDIAHVKLLGNAGMFVRVGAQSAADALAKLSINADGTRADDTSNTYIDATIGKGAYDGFWIPFMDGADVSAEQSTNGEVALDIEGPVRFVSSDVTIGETEYTAAGYVNVPSVLLDHRGKELKFDGAALVDAGARPLSTATDDEFYRYNTSTILVNDYVELEKTTLIHNDVTRDLRTLPSASASPAIAGGEYPSLFVAKTLADNPDAWILDYTGSPIYLYNSTVACHESLVSAGVRWVVHEGVIDTDASGTIDDGETLDLGENTSKIIFYNRGEAYDVTSPGKGRTFQLGSRANTMGDGATIDPISLGVAGYPSSSLRDAFIDVYRQAPLDSSLRPLGTETNTIKLQFSTSLEDGVTDSNSNKAAHVLHLADRSQVNLGWAAGQYEKQETVDGELVDVAYLEVDSNYRPWEFDGAVLSAVVAADPNNTGVGEVPGTRFSPFEHGVGTLELGADNLYISGGGRYSATGSLDPADNELTPASVSHSGGIVYTDFGGKITATGSFDTTLDTVLARRACAVAGGGGVIAAGNDQLLLGTKGRIEPYGYDAAVNLNPKVVDGSTQAVLSIDASAIPRPTGYTPIKGMKMLTRGPDLSSQGHRSVTRATDSVTAPVAMPSSGLLVMTTGDSIEQAQVSGATRANPFHLWLTGDETGFARVREFVSMKSDPAVLGEGAHAALFMSGGARIGLGSRRWNEHSVNAWNQLGQDKVSIFANGNGVIDLNDDLIVIDKLPLVATDNFGQGASAHRIEFHSDVPREIRVLANGELDLSSFGRSLAGFQEIAFSGEVRLVLEPGAKLRLPGTVTSDDETRGPILYFTDNAKLVCLGDNDRDAGRHADKWGADKVRTKILGIGQLQFNKNARMEIFDDALVGVESDSVTTRTDITVSLKRNAGLYVGDDIYAGGALQVGNIVDGGGDGTNVRTDENSVIAPHVSFKVLVNGPQAVCHIDRQGFLGLGVGVINKKDNINGTIPSSTADPTADDNLYDAWELQSLHNVKNITIDVEQGFFSHNQIFDGTSTNASLIALGPIDYDDRDDHTLDAINGGRYQIKMGELGKSFIRGGGNVIFIDAGTNSKAASIWSDSAYLTGSDDTGKYTVLAPGVMVRSYTTPLSSETVVSTSSLYSMTSRTITEANSQGGALIELYSNLSMPIYDTYTANQFVAAGSDDFDVLAAYLVSGSPLAIRRRVVTKDNTSGIDPRGALEKGYFSGTSSDSAGDPEKFKVPS